MSERPSFDRHGVLGEWERVRADFHDLLAAGSDELSRRTDSRPLDQRAVATTCCSAISSCARC